MKRIIGWVLLVVVLLSGGCTWWVMSYGPDTAAEYVDEYGGMESQYEVIGSESDCQRLGQLAADMDARFNRERDRVALGYQKAAVTRMVEIDCP